MNDSSRIGLVLCVTVLCGGCMFGELGIYGQEREALKGLLKRPHGTNFKIF